VFNRGSIAIFQISFPAQKIQLFAPIIFDVRLQIVDKTDEKETTQLLTGFQRIIVLESRIADWWIGCRVMRNALQNSMRNREKQRKYIEAFAPFWKRPDSRAASEEFRFAMCFPFYSFTKEVTWLFFNKPLNQTMIN
jgi:hypothetical protein